MATISKEISDVVSEAAVVASVLLNPSLVYFSENLKSKYFTQEENSLIYYAVCELAAAGIDRADVYNVMNTLSQHPKVKARADALLNNKMLEDMFENAPYIARTSAEDYKKAADSIVHAAFRRETIHKLDECKSFCISADQDVDIEKKLYSTIDEVMMRYSMNNENIPLYKDVVRNIWNDIVEKQKSGGTGIPFKFPELNKYCMIEQGELFVVGGKAKAGKSMFLLNEAADLITQGYSVLYIDSELSSEVFTRRLVSNLTGISYRALKDGSYFTSQEAVDRVDRCISWLETRNFVHHYMPILDADQLYTIVRKVNNIMPLQVVIVDYFKTDASEEAFASSARLGSLVDLVKNRIAGAMNIAALGACQINNTSGRVADSDRIVRYASTICTFEDKTEEEIQNDGVDCGNKKLRVVYNRSGAQMSMSDQYIDLQFDGNKISLRQAKEQHAPEEMF